MAKKDAKKIINENLDKIEAWAAQGLSQKQIAKNIGLSDCTLSRHMKMNSGLSQSIKKGRSVAVEEIENAMYKSATGYVRKNKKYAKLKRILYDEMTGKKTSEFEEMVEYEEEVYYPPDNTAGIFLLKNWGGYTNEPATIKLRKEELELKKKQIEANVW